MADLDAAYQARRSRALVASAAWVSSGREPALKGKKRQRNILKANDVERLMDTCGVTKTGLRAQAMIAVLYGCDLGISDACALACDDPLPRNAFPRAVRLVDEWRAVAQQIVGPSGPLFCTIVSSSAGRATSTSYWRHLFPVLSTKAGVPAVSPSDLVWSGRLARRMVRNG